MLYRLEQGNQTLNRVRSQRNQFRSQCKILAHIFCQSGPEQIEKNGRKNGYYDIQTSYEVWMGGSRI